MSKVYRVSHTKTVLVTTEFYFDVLANSADEALEKSYDLDSDEPTGSEEIDRSGGDWLHKNTKEL